MKGLKKWTSHKYKMIHFIFISSFLSICLLASNDGLNHDLLEAAKQGRYKEVESLLGRGVDVNSKNENGETALMLAVKANKKASVNALLKKNADVSIKDPNGKTAIDFAQNDEIKNLLKDATGKIPSTMEQVLNSEQTNSISPQSEILIKNEPQEQSCLGVMVHPGPKNIDVTTRINVARKLGVKYIRTSIVIEEWDGRDEKYESYLNAGFKVLLNIDWGKAKKGDEPVPFPTDLDSYKKSLEKILEKYRPEVVVIENEEMTAHYHSGSVQDYINELGAAIEVVHSKGLKVTNGGLGNRQLELLVYRDYVKRGMRAQADDFGERTMGDAMLKAAQNPGSNPEMEQIVTKAQILMKAYHDLNLDYVNIHIYEPMKPKKENADSSTPNALKEIADYLVRTTGKPLMANEIGQRNPSTSLIPSMLQAFLSNQFKYIIWFSGDGNEGAVALNNPDGSLRSNGEVFKKFIADFNAPSKK
jgi:hypothetical protein